MENFAVTSKGQVVIPAPLRKKYHIEPGTKVQFIDGANGILLVPITEEAIDANVGFLKTKGALLKKLREEKAEEKKR